MYLVELKCSNHALALAELDAVAEIKRASRGVAVVSRLDVMRRLGMSHRVLEYIDDSPADSDAVIEMVAENEYDFDGTFCMRARAVEDAEGGGETIEREAGAVLYERGYSVELDNPDEEFRLIFTEGRCYFGRLVAETDGFAGREPTEKPFFNPGSMSPMLARALVNTARGYDGKLLLDPMCGTGGILVEGALDVDNEDGARVVGFDSQPRMVEGSRCNFREYDAGDANLGVADATSLPLRDNAVDCAVTDLPYGRASKVESDSLEELNRGVLNELARVIDDGRAVVVSDSWLDDVAREAGFEVVERIEDRVHRSLTRRILVLE
ncbi:MAG: methyltransferase domain-containing protein [Halobacteria archaeon]|nr:methyltransferase domain-containing protein [Halobacteria archaeon]